jgi:hypothetical protein
VLLDEFNDVSKVTKDGDHGYDVIQRRGEVQRESNPLAKEPKVS